jgi:hypothetical protein
MGMQKKNEKKDFSEIVRKWKKWWGGVRNIQRNWIKVGVTYFFRTIINEEKNREKEAL